MNVRSPLLGMFLGIGVGCGFASGQAQGQAPAIVTLADAQAIAVRNHPRIASAALTAEAGESVVKEVRSAYFPTVSGNLTAVGAELSTTLQTGALPTSSLYSRAASGVVANQLLTDFGRTASLEKSAKLRNAAQNKNVNNTRAQVLLEVQQAYYQTLAADSVQKVALATLDLRRVILRQVSALAQSALRSTLDVSFARLIVSEAELVSAHAASEARASHARLSAALGYEKDEPFSLADVALPPALNPDVDALIAGALQNRPDLAALQLSRDAQVRLAESEKRLRNPTVSAAAVAGVAPVRDDRLRET